MNNFIHPGKTLTIPSAPRTGNGGTGVQIGNIFGVASNDTLSGAQQLALQMAMDRLSKYFSTLSNILKKINDTATSLTRPSKASIARATPLSALRRRATALRGLANAEGERGAALLAGVVSPHLGAATRATFVLRACPKRCAYPQRTR